MEQEETFWKRNQTFSNIINGPIYESVLLLTIEDHLGFLY